MRRGRSLTLITRLFRDIVDPITYTRILYLLLALPLGVIEFSFLVTAISFGVGTAVTLIGIPVLIGTVYAWRWMAQVERGLIGTLTGVRIPSPYRTIPANVGWSRKLGLRLADPATWKDLAFLLLQLPIGIVAFTITTVVIGVAAAGLGAPAYWSADDAIDIGFWQIDTLAEAFAVVPLGLLVALIGIPALGALGRLYGRLAALLLGSNADPVLTAQVTDLQGARSRIIAAADAERRRIERDLHDGAQQRLVSLALQLRMAESRAAAGDPEAATLIRGAGEEANLALKDLRDLARGIHPAILTNRGLGAALDDLAARSTVPAEVVACPGERLPDEVEAAAYFVVSEALANVGKHAHAQGVTVGVRVVDGQLVVEVADDGTGGAALGSGSGLQGLEDRVGALDGSLHVHSPPGEGTRLVATIPLSAELGVPELDVLSTPVVLPDDEAAPIAARRMRRMRLRVLALGLVAALLVLLWGLTGMTGSPPWFVWPLLGLGFVAGVDAWVAHAGGPLRESDLAAGVPRDEAVRHARKARSMTVDAGVLTVLNLMLVGVWLAAGAGFFWPIWPIFGCAASFALKAYGWPAQAREQMVENPKPKAG